jgi:uncharacterized membrane protein
MISVCMSGPPAVDIAVEIGEQLWQRDKGQWVLVVINVLVIAFASLVVVTQHASTVMNQDQAILVRVLAARHRAQQPPDDDLLEQVIAQPLAV